MTTIAKDQCRILLQIFSLSSNTQIEKNILPVNLFFISTKLDYNFLSKQVIEYIDWNSTSMILIYNNTSSQVFLLFIFTFFDVYQ